MLVDTNILKKNVIYLTVHQLIIFLKNYIYAITRQKCILLQVKVI